MRAITARCKLSAMDPRRIASIAAVVGGASWLLEVVLTLTDGSELIGVVYPLGLVTMAIALAAGGYTLVETAPVWLRMIVMVATPSLVLMLWLMVDSAVEAVATSEGWLGTELSVLLAAVVALVLGTWGFTRRRDPESAPARTRARSRSKGRRAAR